MALLSSAPRHIGAPLQPISGARILDAPERGTATAGGPVFGPFRYGHHFEELVARHGGLAPEPISTKASVATNDRTSTTIRPVTRTIGTERKFNFRQQRGNRVRFRPRFRGLPSEKALARREEKASVPSSPHHCCQICFFYYRCPHRENKICSTKISA